MTAAEITVLFSNLRPGGTTRVMEDRWNLPSPTAQFDHPDFGWKVAVQLAESRQTCAVLHRLEYRWVRAAVQLLKGRRKASRRLSDVEMVSAALALFQSDSARPVLNGCLITAEATITTVAAALHLAETVVQAYTNLHFNVVGRRHEFAFIRAVVAGRSSGGLLLESLPPTEDEALLQVGFRGTIEDVLREANCIADTANESAEVLSDRILHNLLVAADSWTGSPRSQRQPPSASVSQAIDYVKRSKSEAVKDTPVDTGFGIGEVLREQLERDAAVIRKGMAMMAQQESAKPLEFDAA